MEGMDLFHVPSEEIDRIEAQERNAAAYRHLSEHDEQVTVWDTPLELDVETSQVRRARNVFDWIAFVEGLDAAIAADALTASRRERIQANLESLSA